MVNSKKLILFFLVSICFFFTPLMVTQIIEDNFRQFFLIFGLSYLIFKTKISYEFFNNCKLIICFLFIYSIYYLFQSDLYNIFKFYFLIICLLLFYLLINDIKNNKKFIKTIKDYYIFIFYILSITNILNFFYILNFNDFYKVFNFNTNTQTAYIETIFGIGMYKNLTFIDFKVVKVFSFFNEPIWASIFFFLNAFYIKHKKSRFNILNFISGILTFTYTFYFLVIIKYLILNRNKFSISFFINIFIFISIFLYFSEFTSLSDRVLRLNLFNEVYFNSSLTEYIFGMGWNYNFIGKSPSSGVLFLIYEIGFLGLFFYLVIIYKLLDNPEIFFILFLILILLPITRSPLFIITLSLCINDSNKYSYEN